MVSAFYEQARGWGVFITICLVICYLLLNAFFHPFGFGSALSFWISWGSLLFISPSGLFIYLHFVACKELTDEDDRKKVWENSLVLMAGLTGFFIWLLVLILLDLNNQNMNVYVSFLCGIVVFLLAYYLFRAIGNQRAEKIVSG
jgi:L-asparagine transporter-like permease